MRFTKIKITKQNKIEIKYQVRNGRGTMDNLGGDFDDEPVPSFMSALQDMNGILGTICEQPKENRARITMTGVSFNYHGENDVMGVVLTGTMKLVNSTGNVLFNSPERVMPGEKPNPKKDISDELKMKIDVLQQQAVEFLNGKRQQEKLELK